MKIENRAFTLGELEIISAANQEILELVNALKAAILAIEYAEKHYLPSYSAGAEVWSFVNGYGDSPDVRQLLKGHE